MPFSYDYFKEEIKRHFEEHVSKSSKILDVGPGSGTYSKLLKPSGFKLDCVEVWEPYVREFNLSHYYEKIAIQNIMDFDFTEYHYIILGDVLEHLTAKDASTLLSRIEKQNIKCLVAVPFEYQQSSYEGNYHEIHLQPDLTPGVMKARYKNLHLLYRNELYGYYTNYYQRSFLEKVKPAIGRMLQRFIITLRRFVKIIRNNTIKSNVL